jgi:hypothetical protein
MLMDMLLALHPDLQRVIHKQLASLMSTPQLVDMLELLPPPPILLGQDLIYKTEMVLLGPPPLQRPLRRLLRHRPCRLHQLRGSHVHPHRGG